LSEGNTLPWYNIFQSIVTVVTLAMTIFLAWYVNDSLRKKMYHHELDEKRLRELYRPMDIILRSSKMAFQRYLKAESEEQVFIADLWGEYNKAMKDLIIKNAYLFIEPELPPEISRLMEHIDVYLFDYQQYKQGKRENPFPGERGYPFPSEINDYFANSSQQLVKKTRDEMRRASSNINLLQQVYSISCMYH
jgi:hypothetical protein